MTLTPVNIRNAVFFMSYDAVTIGFKSPAKPRQINRKPRVMFVRSFCRADGYVTGLRTSDEPPIIGTAVTYTVLPLNEDLSQKNISCDRNFVANRCTVVFRHFLVRMHIAKCFKKNSKRFRCEEIKENEHTFCS